MGNQKTMLLAVVILLLCEISVGQFKSQRADHAKIQEGLALLPEHPQLFCAAGVGRFNSLCADHVEIQNDLVFSPEQPQPEERMGFWPKLGYLMLAHGIYSTVDALVYPIVSAQQNHPRRNVPLYRVGQGVLEFGLGRLLTSITGDVKVEVAFHIQHWTWLNDFMYYPIYDALHGTNAYREEVSGGHVTWAGWTPVGLYRWSQGRQREAIDERTLIIQSAAGFSVGVVLVLL